MDFTGSPKEPYCGYSGQHVTSIVVDRIQQQITLTTTMCNNTKDCNT